MAGVDGRAMKSMAGGVAAPSLPRPHVVLVACPGAGHVFPLAQLAGRLVDHHGFAATLLTFADLSSPESLSCIPASVASAVLPAVLIDDFPAGASTETVFMKIVRRSLPSLRVLLRSISSTAPLAALVPDFFCCAALPLAAELSVPGYIFFPANLAALAVMHRLLELHDGVDPGEYLDLPSPLELPGGVSLRPADIPESFQNCKEPVYAHILEEGRRYQSADGILVNSFYELDPAAVEYFKQATEQGTFPPVIPVGPFVLSRTEETGASGCLDWLDKQPSGSVVYVCFGSAGALSVEQTAELAAGLEASGHRFLWVVRMPKLDVNEDDRRGNNPLAWLPEGFLERTKDRGLAVASWAPQVRVLSHPATAVFVSHCGWNSTLESMSSGMPMVVWPLFAEQRMNAVILERSLRVALRPREREEDGVIPRDEIVAVVRELMEGEKGIALRRHAGDLQQAAARAVSSPEGSSHRALEEVAGKWKAALASREE